MHKNWNISWKDIWKIVDMGPIDVSKKTSNSLCFFRYFNWPHGQLDSRTLHLDRLSTNRSGLYEIEFWKYVRICRGYFSWVPNYVSLSKITFFLGLWKISGFASNICWMGQILPKNHHFSVTCQFNITMLILKYLLMLWMVLDSWT